MPGDPLGVPWRGTSQKVCLKQTNPSTQRSRARGGERECKHRRGAQTVGAQRQSPRGEMPAARRGERALLLQLALLWCPLLAGGTSHTSHARPPGCADTFSERGWGWGFFAGFGDDEDAAGASLEPLCDDKGGVRPFQTAWALRGSGPPVGRGCLLRRAQGD